MKFPIVDAYLVTPEDSASGRVGICTNTTAPGQVLNELEMENRKDISVLGSLIVNRDGTERMILNALVHPTVQIIILFSEETITFSPSTNLLLALQYGIDPKASNQIRQGKAASSHYPNLSEKILDAFRENILVLPLFMYKNDFSKQVVTDYINWIKPKISEEMYEYLNEMNGSEKIYYNKLNKLVKMVSKLEVAPKQEIQLDAKDFQHLQPPVIELPEVAVKPRVPFKVSHETGVLRLDIKVGEETFFIQGTDEFLLEFSFMKFLGEKKDLIPSDVQLFLGAELARVNTELKDNISAEPFVEYEDIIGATEIPMKPIVGLVPDEEYYYKINIKNDQVAVQCLAFDVCEEVWEIHAKSVASFLKFIGEKNRFQKYKMDLLHRLDVGSQIARAVIATQGGYSFMQDFYNLFKINTERLPFFYGDSETFIDGHKKALMHIYTAGLTEQHADEHKGLARTSSILIAFREAEKAFESIPRIYQQGKISIPEMREQYKNQLLRFDHDGNYSYGERTRAYYGFDQLARASEKLKANPNAAYVTQRFDPTHDMGTEINPETGKVEFTHDPCLTHDVFWINNGKLFSFHVARAHNTVNAYPENVLGLHDAYVMTIRKELGLETGDMFMLSSRANILMLTEEQRTKKILAEPSKGVQTKSVASGPYQLNGTATNEIPERTVSCWFGALQENTNKPTSRFLEKFQNYNGVNILDRAITYLKDKGLSHNNPVLSAYDPKNDDPQGEHLISLQVNVYGKKVYATCVFINRSHANVAADRALINYVATEHSKRLGVPLGDATIFYIS